MGRNLRPQEVGLIYHIINKGNNDEYVFKNSNDKDAFMEALKKAYEKYFYDLLAYVIMDNHYHLLIRTNETGTISQIMHHIACTYTRYYKKIYGKSGHIFKGRYKSRIIENEVYLLEVSKYIHLNPYKAEMVKNPIDYKYSSLQYYFDLTKKEPILNREVILDNILGSIETKRKIYLDFVMEGKEY